MSFSNSEIVKTRKEYQCFGCLKEIKNGEHAVKNQGYDEGWFRFYLHQKCDKIIEDNIETLNPWGDGVKEGAVLEL